MTVTGTKLGPVMAGGQQRLLIAANRTLQQQQQLQKQKRPLLQKPKQKQQISTNKGQETSVSTTSNEGDELPAQQDLGNYIKEYIININLPYLMICMEFRCPNC